MIYRMLNRIVPLLAATIVLLLAGCGGGGSEPASDPLVKPTLGSAYLFDNSRIDTGGHIVGTQVDTLTVLSTNATVAGMSGMITLLNGIKHDTIHLHYDANSDLTLLSLIDSNHDGVAEALVTSIYPVATHKSVENGRNTTYSSGSGYTQLIDSTLYLGDQTVATPAGTFKVAKVADVVDIRNYSSGVMTSRAREVSTYYYARSVGFFVKIVGGIERYDASNRLVSDEVGTQLELRAYKPG